MSLELTNNIEALLFTRTEPITIEELVKLTKATKEEVYSVLQILNDMYQNRGVNLISNGDTYMFGTSAACATFLETVRKEELDTELSKASLETLAIILYGDTLARSEIDFIRGVNSSFILRNLSIRGLISREVHPTDTRKFIYRPTVDLLRYLGITSQQALGDYEIVSEKLKQFKITEKSTEA